MARADHIYVRRSAGYTHHGIDCGEGTVIHFTGEPGTQKINASIARTPIEEFLDGGELKIRRYGKRDDPDTTMERAEASVGDSGYHLVINNCEHFATWCCTGRKA
ncbi:MAG TPA: lecithin retinol acyltransferase family protein, partial [Trueperaceae bacterium]|nr:lecithin retinol acyltransferase family protein [Trueperaceae bacterium]